MASVDELLDEALEMTFPASDPVSIGVPADRQPVREPRQDEAAPAPAPKHGLAE